MIFALTGLTSCVFGADEDSLVGEWGLLKYTYTTTEKAAQSEQSSRSTGYISDQTARCFAFIFKEDGSGENLRYGYYTDNESTQFENDYYSYPFTWSINNGKLYLNYPGESPMDPEDPFDVGTTEENQGYFFKRMFPVGTEFDMRIFGGKLILNCNQTTDTWTIDSTIKLERK